MSSESLVGCIFSFVFSKAPGNNVCLSACTHLLGAHVHGLLYGWRVWLQVFVSRQHLTALQEFFDHQLPANRRLQTNTRKCNWFGVLCLHVPFPRQCKLVCVTCVEHASIRHTCTWTCGECELGLYCCVIYLVDDADLNHA